MEAEQTLQEAIRLEPGKSRPDIADIRWRAGLVYEKLGRPSNARTHYQAAAEADPESWIGQQSRQAADRLATVS